MITNISTTNSFSTCLLSIRLLISLPTTPPPIPPATIRTSQSHSNSGTVFVNSVVAILVICETKEKPHKKDLSRIAENVI